MKTWYNGNFPTHQAEIAHMKALREQGYNNREIAKMVGRNLNTIYKNIGKQPKIMTELSKQLAGERKAKENKNRKIAVATIKRQEYEKRLAEQKAAIANRDKVRETIIRMMHEASERVGNANKAVWDYKAEYEQAMNVLRSA